MSETHAESVLIVDDHPLFRKGLVQLLKTVNGFRLVGEAAGGVEGMEMARQHAVDRRDHARPGPHAGDDPGAGGAGPQRLRLPL